MPYKNIKSLPENIKNVLPVEAQRIWMRVFNKTMDDGGSEDKARKIAWVAVKKAGYEKKEGGKWVKNMSEERYFVPFSERDDGWFMYFPLGRIYHRGRSVDFTADDATEMVNNFHSDIPGYDLPINILHQDHHGVFGYISDLRFNGNEVQWRPKFREEKKEEVKELGYKYFSPEIYFKGYQSREGSTYNNVAMGGALTPRPRLGRQATVAVFSDEEKSWEYTVNQTWIDKVIDGINEIVKHFADDGEKEEYECECLDCGYKMKTDKHCSDIECPECGGEMRRSERPGEGKSSDDFADYKTEDGQEYSKSAYLIVPDPDKPSTWKIKVESSPGKVTVKQLGAAAAALNSYRSSETYRGKSLKGVTPEQVASAKRKLISLYKKQGVEKEDIPEYLFKENDDMSKVAEEIIAHIDSWFEKRFGDDKEEVPQDFSEELNLLKDQVVNEFSEQLNAKDGEIAELSEAKKELEVKAQELSDRFAEEERKRRLAEFTDKAEELGVPVEAMKFGEILMKFHDADESEDKEDYNTLLSVIEAKGKAQEMEHLFKEKGSDADDGDNIEKFSALVKERMDKTGENWGEASEHVMQERPELYAEYDREAVKSSSSNDDTDSNIEIV